MSDFETWTSAKPIKSKSTLSPEERKLLPTAKRWSLAVLRGITYCMVSPVRLAIYLVKMSARDSAELLPAKSTSNELKVLDAELFEYVEDQYLFHDTSSPGFVGTREPVWAEGKTPHLPIGDKSPL
jgi:hypothetical protein